MKMPATFALLALFSGVLFAGPAATNEHVVSNTGTEAVKAYKESYLLKLPAGINDLEWRVRSGKLEFLDQKKNAWVGAPDQSFLPKPVTGDWEGFIAGATPAIGREPFYADFSLSNEFDFKALGFLDSRVIEVGRKLVPGTAGSVLPEISVFMREPNAKNATKIGTFRLTEETFQYRLSSVFALSEGMIGIIADSDHPDANSLILFDLNRKKPVGYLPFSALQYLPDEQALWAAKPVTKAREQVDPEAVQKARAEASVVPVWVNGKLNPELAESDLFGIAADAPDNSPAPKPETPSVPPSPASAATPHPGVETTVLESPQKKTTAWRFYVVLGAALLGIAGWLLAKRRR